MTMCLRDAKLFWNHCISYLYEYAMKRYIYVMNGVLSFL